MKFIKIETRARGCMVALAGVAALFLGAASDGAVNKPAQHTADAGQPAGSLQPNLGGGILAHNTSLQNLQDRVNEDPFVAEHVVSAEILEMTPAKADERLSFLLG